jgi:ABC-type multidrug transport system, ATPase component
MNMVDIKSLNKSYGGQQVLFEVDLQIGPGEIVGLIGPNGAGKSTLLKAIMGLVDYQGHLHVFDKSPYQHRTEVLTQMSYIADVASLPNWMKVSDLLDYVDACHPKFAMQTAVASLKQTNITLSARINTLSKGMKTRLHLCILLAIDTPFYVLDEPTIGLDVLVRREFQDQLVADFHQSDKSILITTHQVDEIESILTRVVFIREGRIRLDIQLSELKQQYAKLKVDKSLDLSSINPAPIYTRVLPEHKECIFSGVDVQELASLGEVSTPSLEDLFVATNS